MQMERVMEEWRSEMEKDMRRPINISCLYSYTNKQTGIAHLSLVSSCLLSSVNHCLFLVFTSAAVKFSVSISLLFWSCISFLFNWLFQAWRRHRNILVNLSSNGQRWFGCLVRNQIVLYQDDLMWPCSTSQSQHLKFMYFSCFWLYR